MSATETTETVTDTEETSETTPGVGGIVGETAPEPITTLDELVDVIQTQRTALATSNQRNADLFNQIQDFITEKSTGVTQLDGAISAIASFVTEETPEEDEHVVRLNELQTERAKTVEEIQNADTQRRNVFNSITMTEGALQILAQVLTTAGLSTDTTVADAEEGVTTEAE
tara:strand:+ start:412 stop:924 length:513 start_codon:yes stop_codon:yes gene_type:complete